jgi:hypothetical protein
MCSQKFPLSNFAEIRSVEATRIQEGTRSQGQRDRGADITKLKDASHGYANGPKNHPDIGFSMNILFLIKMYVYYVISHCHRELEHIAALLGYYTA